MKLERTKCIAVNVVHQNGRFATVRLDDVRWPNGSEGTHTVFVSGTGAGIVVLPIVGGDSVLMVCQFRYPTGKYAWELPRAFADPERLADEQVAGVLERETQSVGGAPVALGHVTPDSGIMENWDAVFAVELPGDTAPNARYPIADARVFTVAEVLSGIQHGLIEDSYTANAVLRAILAGVLPAAVLDAPRLTATAAAEAFAPPSSGEE